LRVSSSVQKKQQLIEKQQAKNERLKDPSL
jgi:hypothetical protein